LFLKSTKTSETISKLSHDLVITSPKFISHILLVYVKKTQLLECEQTL